MSTAVRMQQAIGEARSLVHAARDVWASCNGQRIVQAPALLSSAIEIIQRANQILLAAPLSMRRCAGSQTAALAREVTELAQLVDGAAAFYRGIAGRVRGAGVAYDSCGLAAVVPELTDPPRVEV